MGDSRIGGRRWDTQGDGSWENRESTEAGTTMEGGGKRECMAWEAEILIPPPPPLTRHPCICSIGDIWEKIIWLLDTAPKMQNIPCHFRIRGCADMQLSMHIHVSTPIYMPGVKPLSICITTSIYQNYSVSQSPDAESIIT